MNPPLLLSGVAAAPGIALGPALVLPPMLDEDAAALPADDPAAELVRLEQAIAVVHVTLLATEARLRGDDKADEAEIFAAHRLLLDDPALRERTAELIAGGYSASAALAAVGEAQAAELLALADPYFSARAADVRDVVAQVRRTLAGGPSLGERLTAPAIIVAQDLGPSDLMSVPRERLLGFALAAGGLTAHATILARSLEIPAVIRLGPAAFDQIQDGDPLALDGVSGQVIVHPDAVARGQTHAAAEALAAQRAELRGQRDLATITRDGQTVTLVANVASAAEARAAREWGAAGVGLLRTELLFTGATLPSEEEQLVLYLAVAAELPGLPIVVRTLDVGGDKKLPALPLPREDNPFLGWRGIRIGLSQPELLLPQLRALLRAGAVADIRIMLPMISTVAEVRQARALLLQAHAELRAAGLPCAASPRLGVMIEVPAAALTADGLAQEADFFSIGTNDLTQYTLAVERLNPRVATLYEPLEPAVLRLIAMTCEAAHRHGRHVAVCGETAGDPSLTALLIGLGVEELSCAPPQIPLVRAAIRATDAAQARAMAGAALAATSLEDVRRLVGAADASRQ